MNVIDNVLSEKYSDLIFDECAKLPWTFVPDISFGSQAKRSVPGFSHSFYLGRAPGSNPRIIGLPSSLISSEKRIPLFDGGVSLIFFTSGI